MREYLTPPPLYMRDYESISPFGGLSSPISPREVRNAGVGVDE